jgi:pimeloyl-ACP methyl ester carboxylesterase
MSDRLHVERLGPTGPPMAFLHPNPLDTTAWLFQMAHFSSWYRTVAIDLPGYGRTGAMAGDLTMREIAKACWDAVDTVSEDPSILVGCSVGACIIPHMAILRPHRVAALVVSGVPRRLDAARARARIAAYETHGLAFRREHASSIFSRTFNATAMGRYFVEALCERNEYADPGTIIAMYRALGRGLPDRLWSRLTAPTLVISGSEDVFFEESRELASVIPTCEVAVIDGAGHACNLEQPWQFDRAMQGFLSARGLGCPPPAGEPSA